MTTLAHPGTEPSETLSAAVGTRLNGRFAVVPAREAKGDDAEFIMLRNGRIYFQGHATELKRSTDSYLKAYLSGWIPPLI